MSERNIVHDDPTEPTAIEKRLLASARIDVPGAGGKQRALAALGLAAAATTATSAGGATSAGVIATSLAKWIVMGALGGVVTSAALDRIAPVNGSGGGSAAAPRPREQVVAQLEPQAHAHSAPPAAPRPLQPPAPESRPESGESEFPLPKPVAGTSASAPRRAATPSTTSAVRGPAPAASASEEATVPPESSAGTLVQEVSFLEAARRELASGQADASLRQLDEFHRRFPRPNLGPEAALTRLEALVALGRFDDARPLGARLLREQPDTAYAQRVRSLLGTAATNP